MLTNSLQHQMWNDPLNLGSAAILCSCGAIRWSNSTFRNKQLKVERSRWWMTRRSVAVSVAPAAAAAAVAAVSLGAEVGANRVENCAATDIAAVHSRPPGADHSAYRGCICELHRLSARCRSCRRAINRWDKGNIVRKASKLVVGC